MCKNSIGFNKDEREIRYEAFVRDSLSMDVEVGRYEAHKSEGRL